MQRDLGLDENTPSFEVHSIRQASQVNADGKLVPQMIVALTQSRSVPATNDVPAFERRGGATLVVDLAADRGELPDHQACQQSAEASTRRGIRRGERRRSAPITDFGSGHPELFAVLHALTVSGE